MVQNLDQNRWGEGKNYPKLFAVDMRFRNDISMQAACPDPILHCHGYSPGFGAGLDITKWHSSKSNARSFGIDEFDQGSVQFFLRFSKLGTNVAESYLSNPHPSKNAYGLYEFHKIEVGTYKGPAEQPWIFRKKVEIAPTHTSLRLGRRINGKTKMTTWAHGNPRQTG